MSISTAATQLTQHGLPRAHPNMKNINNPVVFLDISINNTPAERVVIELYADICPKTAENFRQFCTGEHSKSGVPVGYKNSVVHRVVPNFMVQGGDFVAGNGTGRACIYGGEVFDDEDFSLPHSHAGLLAMANSGPNTNGCQWYITLGKCEWLDGKHVVFGQVLQGLLAVRKVEQVPCGPNSKPKLSVVITQCGEL